MKDRRQRITVSLPADVVDHAKAAVAAGRAPDVSAYVAEALQARARHETFDRDVWSRVVADVGEPGAEHYAWAARVLGLDQANDGGGKAAG